MPKRYIVFKWVCYAVMTLLLVLLDTFLFRHIRIGGIFPFLPPMIVGVVSSYEGSKASPFFALVFGLLCDLTLYAPAPGFFCLIFTLSALISSLLAENLFSPGLLCSFVSALLCYLFTALGRIFVLLTAGETALGLICALSLQEFLLSLPLLLLIFPFGRWVYTKTTIDY